MTFNEDFHSIASEHPKDQLGCLFCEYLKDAWDSCDVLVDSGVLFLIFLKIFVIQSGILNHSFHSMAFEHPKDARDSRDLRFSENF